MALALAAVLPFSPAMLILVFPLAFRITCYYYRGAYYKAFWADPPACAVGEPRKTTGRTSGRSDPERAPLLPVLRAGLHRAAVDRRGERVPVQRSATGPRQVRRRAWARSSCSQRDFCSAATPSAATRFGTSWAASSTSSRGARAQEGSTTAPAASTGSTSNGRGSACSAWRSPIVYIRLCAMGVIHRPEALLMAPISETARARRPRHRRRRRRPARGHRGVGGGRVRRPRLQVAARQGAHRHGRGRHGRGDGQRRRPRQLEGPLRRHHARRPVRQQLAHGRAARQGSARPRPRARGLGRASSTAPRTAASSSATSAATATRGWRTSAIAPAWR